MKIKINGKSMHQHGDCPECGKSWDGGRIWEVWRSMSEHMDKSQVQLKKMEKEMYSPPYHFSELIAIELPNLRDGISFYQCPFCKATWDRDTGEKMNKELVKELSKIK